MSEPIHVGALDDIPCGEGIKVDRTRTGTVDDIAVLRDEDGSVWALNDTCTHAQASLADGWVEGGYVECPLHTSRFCLKTGMVQNLPATEDAVTHTVQVRDGQVYLLVDPE